MSDSNMEPASVGQDLIRSVFSILDRPAYALLGVVYRLFFTVASADLFSNQTILKFYGRVQAILGVFMMFQLSMSILKGIVNPDSFTGDKGARNLITKIITALLLFTILMPIGIPSPKNEYEKQISRNGLLFGTLYSLQHRVLSNNTLGRLVLGTTETSPSYFSSSDGTTDDDLKTSSNIFTSTILKGFYRINLIPEDQRDDTYLKEGKDPAIYNDNRVCTNIDDDILEEYTRIDADPGEIISMVNLTCDSNINSSWLGNILNNGWTNVQKLTGTTKYVFAYTPFISMIVPWIFVFILLSFTIDIAVRAIKLAVLRLLAPIPIISYMDPNGSKDGAFNSWVKALSSTYLDLFIRLAVVYFVIFLIQDMIINGIIIDAGEGVLKVFATIVIWIGLFVFAKQAPKFIKQILGLKEDNNIFGGAFGLAAALPGAIGSGFASARASRLADETRQSYGEKDIFGNEVDSKKWYNRGKHLIAGITGGLTGGYAGYTAGVDAKDKKFNAALEAMRKRNSDVISRGSDGSTLLGRMRSTANNVFTGEGKADSLTRTIETNKSRISALEDIKKRVSGEMVKKDWTSGDLGIATDNSGNAIGKVNFKGFEANLAAARSRGDGVVNFVDVNGVNHTITLDDAERQRGFLLKNNEDDYLLQHTSGSVATSEIDDDLMSYIRRANILGGSSDFTTDADGKVTKGQDKKVTNRKSVNEAIDKFKVYNNQLDEQNAINKANDRFSGKK